MKKILTLVAVFVLTIALAACGKGDSEDKTIKVGASPAPHAEILEKAKPLLEKKGYDLKIQSINDYTTPNKLLDKGELDANYFQHTPYLKTESKEKGYKIESAGNVHLEPMAVYSKKYKSLKDLPNGATVYVSNNPAEQGRFLKFFVDVDAAIINSNYAIDQKLSPKKDSIVLEKATNNPYANLIAVRKGHKDDKKIKALIEVLQSKEIKDFINKKYDGAVVPAK